MLYRFDAVVKEENGIKQMDIPFNVWEVHDGMGELSARVMLSGKTFACVLIPVGKGVYYIPLEGEMAAHLETGTDYEVVLEMMDSLLHDHSGSPYSQEAPIRVIDSITLLQQPYDGLCGQACIGMLAGVSLDDACDIMHCREWQANMSKMVETMDYLGIAHANEIIYTGGRKDVVLPKCCIMMEKMGRYSHYLIHFDGRYYDPTMGEFQEFDMENLKGYLEVKTV